MKETKAMLEKFIEDFMTDVENYYLFTEEEIFEQTGLRGRKGIFLPLSKAKFERVCECLVEINEKANGKFKISIVDKKERIIHIKNLSPEKGS